MTIGTALDRQGLTNLGRVFWNPPTASLYEEAIRRHEGVVAHLGPLVVRTGDHTGRSPQDKFLVREASSEGKIWWEGNRPFTQEGFQQIERRLRAYLQGKDVFVQDCYAGASPQYRLPIRVITETAWHSLFARNLFIVEHDKAKLSRHVPEFTILHAPHFHASPEVDGTASEAFILLNFGERRAIIGGTAYAGEIKKSIFTVLNYLLPQRQVLTLHSSINVGVKSEDVAIFFGLSGTGKTTLATDPSRRLLGDDEHGWSEEGTFNLEGGCYAKVIRLSKEDEPEIYDMTRRFGTVIENVAVDPETRRMDLNDASLTENTRAAYPIGALPMAITGGQAGHPKVILMLTADAFGVLPPISRLNPAQAIYHFLSGYTAKVAGTEAGVTEPRATFSPCFDAPFMALPPSVYAALLGERIQRHDTKVFLVNTGWTGGSYGEGKRISIAYTRTLVRAAIAGQFDDVQVTRDPVFGFEVPQVCPGVPADVLEPRTTWRNPAAYDVQARQLATMFVANFEQFREDVAPEVRVAGPGER